MGFCGFFDTSICRRSIRVVCEGSWNGVSRGMGIFRVIMCQFRVVMGDLYVDASRAVAMEMNHFGDLRGM